MLDVEPIEATSDIGDPLVTSAQLTISTVDVVYDDGSRHTVATSSRTIDMLAATDTITLGVADVPEGTITAVDVQVDSAEVVRDGEVLAVDVIGGGTIGVSPGVQVEVGCTRVVTASFDPNTSFTFIPPDDPDPAPGECDEVFDFEALAAGTMLRDQLAGVTMSCDNARDRGPNECLIFDSDMVTGDDDDLAGGNGNIVIIAENLDDGDGDGLVDDPDDDSRGGVQTYTFDPPIDLDSVFVIDIDLNETNGKLVVVDAEGTTTERELPPIGNASTQTIDVRTDDVARLEVHLPSSGAVDDIAYHTDCPGDGEPDPGSFELTPSFRFVSSELACDEPPPGPDTVVALIQYDAPEFGDAAQELSRLVGGTPEYRSALADVRTTLRPTAVFETLNTHCSDSPTFAEYMPVAECLIDEAAVPALADALHPIGSVVGVREVDVDSTQTTHPASDESRSFSFRNMDIDDELAGIDGSRMRIGVIEFTACDANGQPRLVDDRDESLAQARVTHLNSSTWEPTLDEPWSHMHAVVTSMTHLDRSTKERDIIPRASFFVGNVAKGVLFGSTTCPTGSGLKRSLVDALDFFVDNGVRLVNRSTIELTPDLAIADCDKPEFDKEVLVDRYARTYDWVVTAAAGQEEDARSVCPVVCDALNQICVGGTRDDDHSSVGGSADLTDDHWAGNLDSLTFFFEDPEELDREEPDVVAPARDVVASSPFHRQNISLDGTSVASPLVLALNAKQLEAITSNGPHPWQRCRTSEFIRAVTKFSAGEHSVVSDGLSRRTAPHDLSISDGPGAATGSQCFEPDDCATGLTCLWGRCSDEPRDEVVGWGMASVNDEIVAGDWGCFAADDGTGLPCGLTDDGTCGRPRTHAAEQDPLDIPGVMRRPEPPPSGVGLADRGLFLQSGSFTEGEVYRGVYSWSSCPGISEFEPCDTADDCPLDHTCFGGVNCDPTPLRERRKIPAVDFNVAVYDFEIDRWTWLSYSKDDNLEAFEYVFPRTGSYLFMSFADRDDWNCDESVWGGTDVDYEWDAFVGGVPRWLQP